MDLEHCVGHRSTWGHGLSSSLGSSLGWFLQGRSLSGSRMREADPSAVTQECWKGAEGTSGVLRPVAAWPGERCPKQPLLENRKRREMIEAKGAHLYALVREKVLWRPGHYTACPF